MPPVFSLRIYLLPMLYFTIFSGSAISCHIHLIYYILLYIQALLYLVNIFTDSNIIAVIHLAIYQAFPFSSNSTSCTMFNVLKISFLFSWTWPGTWSCPPRLSWPWPWGGRPGPRWSQWSCKGRGTWGEMRCFRLRTKKLMMRRKIIRVRVAVQRRGISGTWQDMVACMIWWISRKNYLTPSESSWRQTPNRFRLRFFYVVRNGTPLSEDPWYPRVY